MPLDEKGHTGNVVYPTDFGKRVARASSDGQPSHPGRVIPAERTFQALQRRNAVDQKRATDTQDATKESSQIAEFQASAREYIQSVLPEMDLGSNVRPINSKSAREPLSQHVRSFFHLLGYPEHRIPKHLVRMENGVEFLFFNQNLRLLGQSELSFLPDGIFAMKSVSLPECHNLQTLPKRLFVGGDLDISDNKSLGHFPRDLYVRGSVHMRGTFLHFDIAHFQQLKRLRDGGNIGSIIHCPIPLDLLVDSTSQDDFWPLAVQTRVGAEYFILRHALLREKALNRMNSPHAALRDRAVFDKVMAMARRTI